MSIISKYKIIILLLLMAMPASSLLGQSKDVITFFDGKSVHVRWRGIRSADVQGYYVYRQVEQATIWKKLNTQPITMVTERAEAEKMIGYKAGLYFELFGQEQNVNQLSRSSLSAFYTNKKAVAYLEIFSLINPEMGNLLGEIFVDDAIIPGPRVRYKITYLMAGQERDLAISDYTETHARESIPSPVDFTGQAGNESAKLQWKRDKTLMKTGKVVTYQLFKSTSLLGPYEEVNLYGLLPVTVSSGDIKGDDSHEQYQDKYLNNGTNYFYHVKAVNAFGIQSPASVTVEITPSDTRLPSAPSDLRVELFGTSALLNWKAGKFNNRGFEVYKSADRNNQFEKVYPAGDVFLTKTTSWIDIKVEEGDVFFYFVKSVGESGQRSSSSDTITFLYADTRAPKAPDGVKAISTEKGIRLSWDQNTEKDIKGYEIERTGDRNFSIRLLLNTAPITGNTFLDPIPKESQTQYGYLVYAIDNSMNRSKPSEMVKARMPDKVAPQAPIITNLITDKQLITISWTNNMEEDLSHYRIYRSAESPRMWQRIGESLINHYEDSVTTNGMYFYAITALDETGNESGKSLEIKMKMNYQPLPFTPINGVLEVAGNTIRIKWQIPTGSTANGYLITRKEIKSGKALDIAQLGKAVTEFKDLYPDLKKEYQYEVKAFDEAWRFSEPMILKYNPKKNK